MRRMKRRGERKGTVTEKDLYRAILSVLQSHFDSTELSRPASQAKFNDGAVVNISGNADRAMQAHQIGQDAVNDWLSAKLTPERLEFIGMMRDWLARRVRLPPRPDRIAQRRDRRWKCDPCWPDGS